MFLHPLDFAKMYKEHKEKTVFKGKSADDWNAKSKDMAPRVQKSAYVDDFISRMQLSGDETVLDIGCGPGTLAIPLAKKVNMSWQSTFHATCLMNSKSMPRVRV